MCSMCKRIKLSDPKSKYFQARPYDETDHDWDGCEQGSGT